MKDNYETVIVGGRCVLVPYRPAHVLKYHQWMKDPKLLDATASEPLSLEQEYEMQQSWYTDPEKCTFIVLARDELDSLFDLMGTPIEGTWLAPEFIERTLPAMVGDVNLFLSLQDDDDDQGETIQNAESAETSALKQAELDIMIAEARGRGKGIGKEAACLMMKYGASHLQLLRFYCKINESNEASLSLFRSLGFEKCNYVACFQEVEMELKRDTVEDLLTAINSMLEGNGDRLQILHSPLNGEHVA